MEYEFCDCTRSTKLPGKRLMNELAIIQEGICNAEFTDIDRIKLNRKKRKEGIKALKILHDNYNNDRNIKPCRCCHFSIENDGASLYAGSGMSTLSTEVSIFLL